jgi:hypothetical protein
MRLKVVAAALLSTLLVSAAPALAQEQQEQNCRSLDAVIEQARDKYGEILTARAISQAGYMVMLFATPDGSTWTLVGLLKDGKTACTLDAGVAYQRVTPGDQPAPAVPETGL